LDTYQEGGGCAELEDLKEIAALVERGEWMSRGIIAGGDWKDWGFWTRGVNV